MIRRTLLALAVACAAAPVSAGMLDLDTPACAVARAEPTDGNIAACTGRPVSLSAPTFWLVELEPGAPPRAHVVAEFDNAGRCFGAALNHDLTRGSFAVCVPLDEDAEFLLIEYGAHEYGLLEGDF